MCISEDCGPDDDIGPESGPAFGGEQTPLDRVFTSLQKPRRRYLLYYLQEEKSCELHEAARRVAAWEYECDVADVSSKIHDRIESELYHTHLPKLKTLNIIDYDERSGSLRLQDPPDQLFDFLELARAEDGVD